MRRRRVLDELSWIALGAALIVITTLAVGGVDLGDIGDGSSPAEPPATVAQVKGSTSPRQPTPRRSAAPPATPKELVVAAVRGDCWVSLRRGSAAGAVLYEGLLVQGRRARARGGRVFVRLGAAANVDVTVGGKPRPIGPGTVDLVIDVGSSA